MLLDFVDLAPGDWVVQNGANSAVGHFLAFIFHLTIAPSAILATTFFNHFLQVGQAVIQIAKTMGVKTANVVRDRLVRPLFWVISFSHIQSEVEKSTSKSIIPTERTWQD